MTKEEAWRRTKGYLYDALSGEEADEIIKALEQESCEDVISRQAVLEEAFDMSEIDGEHFEKPFMVVEIEDIQKLPSVKPQEKTGYWILADNQDNVDVENGNNRYICSECTFSDVHAKSTEVPYCWHCGARMIEPQGRGEKE